MLFIFFFHLKTIFKFLFQIQHNFFFKKTSFKFLKWKNIIFKQTLIFLFWLYSFRKSDHCSWCPVSISRDSIHWNHQTLRSHAPLVEVVDTLIWLSSLFFEPKWSAKKLFEWPNSTLGFIADLRTQNP